MPNLPPTFRPPHAAKRSEQRRDVDRRRGSAQERGYDSRWQKARKGFLAANPLCVGCEAVGVVRAAGVVDHIVPPKRDKKLFWQRVNWQPLCHSCHDIVKARLETKWQRGEISAADLRLDSAAAQELRRSIGR